MYCPAMLAKFPQNAVLGSLAATLGTATGNLDVAQKAYAAAVLAIVQPSGFEVALEPGRYVVGPAGALLARVIDLKDAPGGHHFAVLDAGMTELIRPALYGSFHRIVPVNRRPGRELCYDVVGPVCESTDAFAHDRRLSPLEVGDLVAIVDAGAYGSAMASNYNRRPIPAEVLVDAGRASLIRKRQSIDDMLALESAGRVD
jgi:diaminopimelate decarboxylase